MAHHVKREAKFGIRFRHWLLANPLGFSATFELKDVSNKKSFPFSEWKEAQRNWSKAIGSSKKGVLMRQLGGSGEPDYTYHYMQPAYLVINFKEGFVLIEADTMLEEIQTSKRKSLTYKRAREISHYKV